MLRLRYLAVLCAGLLLLSALLLSGCAEDVITVPAGEHTSSCVGCHSDADALFVTASEEEAPAAESEGEG